MNPTDSDFDKLLGDLFHTPEVRETAEVQYRRAVKRVKRLIAWLAVGLGVGYCVLVSSTVLIVLAWLKLFGVI